MELDSGTNRLIPLPEFPQRHAPGFPERQSLGFRRFGIVEDDLLLDFGERRRAMLATRVLESCKVDPDGVLPPHFFRDLSVGKRIECLLILALGGNDDTLHFPFKCSACGEELEFELTVAELSAFQADADLIDVIDVDLGGRQIGLHKFSGRDQETLSTLVVDDEFGAAAEIIPKLLIESNVTGPLSPDELHAIEDALDEADPLVNFSCRIECGECGEPNDHEIDLFETALGMLARAQRRLVLSVHRLASRYHWSEREIFAVPEWRREQYLELIGAKV